MAAPPYLMTIVLFRNCCKYGKASDRTDTLSNGEKFLETCNAARRSCELTGRFGWSQDFDSCTDQATTSDRGSFRSSVSNEDLIALVWRLLRVRGRHNVGRESVDFNNLH